MSKQGFYTKNLYALQINRANTLDWRQKIQAEQECLGIVQIFPQHGELLVI